MFCFAEKMVALVKDHCRCCSNRGLSKCISLQNFDADGNSRRRVFEVGRCLDMSSDEVPTNSKVEEKQQRMKRICVEQTKNKELGQGQSQNEDDVPVYNNPVMEKQPVDKRMMFVDRIVVSAQTIAEMVKSLYDTDVEVAKFVYFHSTEAKLPRRRYVMSASFCTDPWSRGCVPQPPPIPWTDKFNAWIAGQKDLDLNSIWFLHTSPMLFRVNVVCVQQQIVGSYALDHEVATLLLRRFHQLDTGVGGVNTYMLWREVLEPDFSFFVPTVLDQGWAAYMWDMMRKEIHVLDPMCCQLIGAEQRHMMHEEAVSLIHTALFCCLNEYFSKRHCTSESWKRKFPKITDDIFTRDECGICMIHAIRQYSGEKMMCPLTKNNIASFRKLVAYEVFRLRDEHGDFVADDVLRAAFDEPEE